VAPFLMGVQYEGDDYVEFTAYISGDKVNVHWTANPRSKINAFHLERSRNGEDFETFKTIEDEGKKPETAEFLESDFNPMMGWSYYRIRQDMRNGKEYVTHIVPVFYRAGRMKKGKLIVPEKIGSEDDATTMKASDFDGQELVFVLRDDNGEEFYYEAILTVKDNRLTLPVSATVPAGQYMITACTKTPLLGIEVIVK